MQYNKWIRKVPCLIGIFLSSERDYDEIKDAISIGAAIQNMLLEACANGLSTCWVGECINYEKAIKDILNIDNRYKLLALVTVGYGAHNKLRKCDMSN